MAGTEAILLLTTEPGDGVVINTPVYPPFFEHIPNAGRRVVEVPLARADGRWELDFDGLEAAFAAGARGYLLASPHNPTGRVFSAADLGRIGSLAGRYGVTVISDEIHASLTAARRAAHALRRGRGRGGRARGDAGLDVQVVQRGRAEGRGGGGRLTVHAGRARPAPAACQYGAGLLGVLASEAAWNSGDEWLDALIRQLDHVRAEFGRLLGERLPRARYVPPEASYLAWVDCSELDLGPEPAEVFLRRGRVALGRGLNFGAPGDGFVRVTIGTSSTLLAEIVDRMAAAGPADPAVQDSR